MASFKDKIIVITGAASGIGRETAKLLASRGALLSISDVNDANLKSLKTEIQELALLAQKVAGHNDGESIEASPAPNGGNETAIDPIFTAIVDVRSREACEKWIVDTVAHFGGRLIDGAANLAGVVSLPKAAGSDSRDSSDEEIDFIYDVNVKGTINSLRAELPYIKEGSPGVNGGAIVNAGSLSGLMGLGGYMPYSSSKHAVIGITRSAAKEEGLRGIRVNAIAPGLIDTPMLRAVAETMNVTPSADMYGRGPVACLGRLGTPLEVAEVVAFLLSPQSGFITGVPITIDGGMSCAG